MDQKFKNFNNFKKSIQASDSSDDDDHYQPKAQKSPPIQTEKLSSTIYDQQSQGKDRDLKEKNQIISELELEKKNLKEKIEYIEGQHIKEREMMKEHHESILKANLDRHQSTVTTLRKQYEAEIEHISSQLENSQTEVINLKSQDLFTSVKQNILKLDKPI